MNTVGGKGRFDRNMSKPFEIVGNALIVKDGAMFRSVVWDALACLFLVDDLWCLIRPTEMSTALQVLANVTYSGSQLGTDQ